jgi:hypothetical protein
MNIEGSLPHPILVNKILMIIYCQKITLKNENDEIKWFLKLPTDKSWPIFKKLSNVHTLFKYVTKHIKYF